MHLVVVERHSPPVVSASLILRGGTAGYPRDLGPALSIASTIASQSTAHLDSAQFADRLNALFADIGSATIPEDSLRFRIRCMSTSFDAALQILHDVVVEPRLDQHLLDVERQHRIAIGQRDRDDPALLGQRLLFQAIFGADHPYAISRMPATDLLPGLTADDVARAWRRAVDPAEATLIVAGDVDTRALVGRVEAMFAGWKHDPAHVPPTPPPPPHPMSPRLFVIDRPGAGQATIFYGMATPPATTPSLWPLAVAAELLGGMPSSRLGRTLRDDLGVAPWSGTRSWWRPGPGVMFWQGAVERDKAPEVLTALAHRVAELREQGPDAPELADAKERVAHVVEREFETAAGMIDGLSQIPLLGWPSDELGQRASHVEAVTAAEVRATLPPPEAMKAVVVGDLGVLRDRLVALGWGEIEERTPEGERVRSFTR
jgi:zinc protease